nr:FAD-dependent oxidoreductase [Ciceribacter sp. L1K23]
MQECGSKPWRNAVADPEVLVIGGGPAGLAAAIEVGRSGYSVCVVEQRDTLGGAIYRQPIKGAEPMAQGAAPLAQWRALSEAFRHAAIPVRFNSVCVGVDGDGLVLVEDRNAGRIEQVKAKAVIIATGAVERVLPRLGWQMAGVATAGGLQVRMKETGRAPEGRVLLAGSGPLLVAVAAQMARLGNPPVAIVEAGDPFRRFRSGLAMLGHLRLLKEAGGYLVGTFLKRVPWIRGATLVAIEREGRSLKATIRRRCGQLQRLDVDRIGLHDGIRPNSFGFPTQASSPTNGPIILHAGDCREALGALAASDDGQRAGRAVAGLLSGRPKSRGLDRTIDRARAAQATLAALFAPVDATSPFAQLPDETVLCRCEGKTVGELRQLCQRKDRLSGREVKHNGRFAMGSCQGRFCADNTAALMAEINPDIAPPSVEDLTGRRWPIRPISIAALTGVITTNKEANKD